MNTSPADLVFGALADSNRRQIVERIAGGGPVTATALAEELSMSRQGAAKHLVMLSDAGILTASRSGREVRYWLTEGGLVPGSEWLDRVGGQWDKRLAALREHVRE